ncbi:hypothetical protein [Flavobacteriaceae bacterium 14752]|uniref:hypothetical protein n=1 Tax=Mesohalobacter salilacus TaxID=2491711 RepID=UPI000F6437C7|nr:hypothetical protein EIG84_07180 [Flavobacteriaceae bacterium 14752]
METNRIIMRPDQFLLVKLISDIGLLVLIWLVQLVIYPSFKYYKTIDLKVWHRFYTKRITIVVLPLMLSQLVLSITLLFISNWSTYHILDICLVLLTWVLTFAIFVPLHQKIDKSQNISESVYKLVKYNWIRTFLWSAIAIFSLYNTLF